jgi:MarR family 2-MHQ and catechol resistance regulon transcriptional repressor
MACALRRRRLNLSLMLNIFVSRDSLTKTNENSGEDDLSGIRVWLVLWRAGRAVEFRAQRSIARFGMVMSDFGVMEALLHLGPLTAKQLGATVLLTSGSVTAVIDRLAVRGLVQREDDARDRRACIVRLTAAGRRLIERAFGQHRAEWEEGLEGFSTDERMTLLPLLRRLERIAEEGLRSANEASAVMVNTGATGSRRGARRSSK